MESSMPRSGKMAPLRILFFSSPSFFIIFFFFPHTFWRNYSLLFDDTGNFNVSCLDVFTPGVLSNIWNVRKENFYLSVVNFSHSVSLKNNYFLFSFDTCFRKFFFFQCDQIFIKYLNGTEWMFNLFSSIRDLSSIKFKKKRNKYLFNQKYLESIAWYSYSVSSILYIYSICEIII